MCAYMRMYEVRVGGTSGGGGTRLKALGRQLAFSAKLRLDKFNIKQNFRPRRVEIMS